MWQSSIKMVCRRHCESMTRVGFACATLLSFACGPIDEPIEFSFSVSEVQGNTLPIVDATKIYRFRQATTNADSMVRALLNARIPVNEAWEPVEDLCMSMDPSGPRFTVVLQTATPRIANHGFDTGNGIRACTTRVRRYLIVRSIF